MTCYEELKARGLIAQVTNEEEISKMINEGKAVFYIGFDPTADSLHVGHFMALCLMKRLQMAGNRPIALIGGGTGMVGDPSGRTDMRSMMTVETIQHNCACFKKQMERFIEFGDGKAQMVNNADWLMDLNYVELLREVGACFSVNNMLRAECYKQRMEKGLSFLEFNYMIMQSYDFYHLFQHYGCNMQFGGDDQWSNMLGGTELIRRKLGKDAHAMTITLLLNSEGKKMGKTAKGAVWLDPNKTSPYEFYQYWRNVGDSDVLKCLRMLTFLPIEQIDEMDKWEGAQLNQAKEILAFELTKLVHGEEEAQKALSELLVCGECGTPYKRVTWARNGKKRIVWRCISRLEFGTKYCHNSPTLDEEKLHQAIQEAINEFAQAGTEVKEDMLTFTAMAWGGDAIDGVSLIDLRQKLKDITAQQALLLDQVLEHMDDEILNAQLKAMMDEKQALQEQIAAAEQSQTHNAAQKSRMAELREWMAKLEVNQQYSDEQVRMAVERITVVDAETIRIRFRYPGAELEKKL